MNTSVKEEQFKIFDNVAKAYVDKVFNSLGEAEAHKEQLLDNGEYPDRPHTVFEIHPVASVKEEVKQKILTAFENLAFAAYLTGQHEHRHFAAWWSDNKKGEEVKRYLEEYSKKQNHELLEALKSAKEAFHISNKNYPDWIPTKELNDAFDLIDQEISKSNINEQ